MTDEKWEQIVGKIKDEFGVESHQTRDGEREREKIEEIIFNGPLGRIKIARSVRPRVLEEKTHYSNRIGGDMGVERVYSDDEFVNSMDIFKDNDGEWVPVDNSLFE